MKTTFRVSRVFDDGSETDALIVPVTALPADTRLGRRVFFRAGVTLSGIAAVLTGCASPDSPHTAAHPPQAAGALPAASSPTPGASAPVSVAPPEHETRKAAPVHRRPRPKPQEEPGTYRYHAPSQPHGGYVGGGETITRPCDPQPVPADYICTCNCVAR